MRVLGNITSSDGHKTRSLKLIWVGGGTAASETNFRCILFSRRLQFIETILCITLAITIHTGVEKYIKTEV